jgi:glutamyl/glutaminyl-tRNA synthetase
MRAGDFPDGSRTLRAKIDMASPNLNMRDPVMYRILHAERFRTETSGAYIRCTTTPMVIGFD